VYCGNLFFALFRYAERLFDGRLRMRKRSMTEKEQSLALQILTTEHFTLQTARSAFVYESTGRINLFLAAVSSGVVAIAFVGQTSRFGESFFAFSLVVLATLVFIGLATYVRVQQTAVAEVMYERGMNRIRHFFVESVPDIQRYFVLSVHDDLAGTSQNEAIRGMRMQPLFTASGMINVVNAVLVGAFMSLLVAVTVKAGLLLDVGCGIAAALVTLVLQLRHQALQWKQIEQIASAEFPTPSQA